MCEAPDIPPAPEPPPPPPPPAEQAPLKARTNEGSKRSGQSGADSTKRKRTGTSALRNDLSTPQPSGKGLQIARG